jgi:hypothetical protein
MTIIASHGCYSPQQDKIYGVGQRLHNRMKSKNDPNAMRCTACGHPLCNAMVKLRGNAETIKQMNGIPLRQGMWTSLGIA